MKALIIPVMTALIINLISVAQADTDQDQCKKDAQATMQQAAKNRKATGSEMSKIEYTKKLKALKKACKETGK